MSVSFALPRNALQVYNTYFIEVFPYAYIRVGHLPIGDERYYNTSERKKLGSLNLNLMRTIKNKCGGMDQGFFLGCRLHFLASESSSIPKYTNHN